MSYIDVYGLALQDYYQGNFRPPLLLHNTYGEPEEMPVDVFFRNEAELSELEQYALSLCYGRVLDVGAGAGAHSLVLQKKMEVVAIERSAAACQVMRSRGVKNVVHVDVFEYSVPRRFDSVLMLMNGTGLAGKYNNFTAALRRMKQLLSTEGQILIDSSDISYLYPNEFPKDHYFGEVSFQYEYEGQQSEWFPWLYLDQKKLKKLSKAAGFDVQIVYEGYGGEYLAVLRVG